MGGPFFMPAGAVPNAPPAKAKNNPMQSKGGVEIKSDFDFYEFPLMRRAKQGYSVTVG
jgi:hypothetical protein